MSACRRPRAAGAWPTVPLLAEGMGLASTANLICTFCEDYVYCHYLLLIFLLPLLLLSLTLMLKLHATIANVVTFSSYLCVILLFANSFSTFNPLIYILLLSSSISIAELSGKELFKVSASQFLLCSPLPCWFYHALVLLMKVIDNLVQNLSSGSLILSHCLEICFRRVYEVYAILASF